MVLHFIILEGSFHSFYGDSGWIAYFILILHMIFFVIFWISHFDDIYFFSLSHSFFTILFAQIPNWCGGEPTGSTKDNPFPLPDAYMESLQRNVRALDHLIPIPAEHSVLSLSVLTIFFLTNLTLELIVC